MEVIAKDKTRIKIAKGNSFMAHLVISLALKLIIITLGQCDCQHNYKSVNDRNALANPNKCNLYVKKIWKDLNVACGFQCTKMEICYNFQYFSVDKMCIFCIAVNSSVQGYDMSVFKGSSSDLLEEKIWEKTDVDDCIGITCGFGCSCIDKAYSYECFCPVCNKNSGNHAYLRPTQQSSAGTNSKKAVDGNFNTNYGGGSCTHTDGTDSKPWWSVSLSGTVQVRSVVMTNRADCCAGRLSHITIYVSVDSGNPDTSSEKQICNTYTGPAGAGSKVTVTCNKPICGKFVIIQIIPPTSAQHWLTLCEVEIFS